jgi:hypothetical protein
MTDVWVDLVLLKVLNLSFELKPILPLVWTPNKAERQRSTYQPRLEDFGEHE